MKKRIGWLLFSILLLGCSNGGSDGDEATMSKEFINVIQDVELLGDGDSQQIEVKANVNWNISKDADWLSVSPTSSNKTEMVTLSAPQNTTGSERFTILIISGGNDIKRRVLVTQGKPADKSNSLVPEQDDNMPPS